MKRENVVLIGMSGAGKSTLGVLLAKALGKQFADTDLLIQQRTGRLLQQIIDSDGIDRFLEIEEETVLGAELHGCVIATGGSVVYSDRAMESLRRSGTVVYLAVSFEELESRLGNITTRGIVFKGSNDLRAVFEERLPLYQKYADVTLDCTDFDIEGSVRALLDALEMQGL
ncbi:MAG: shikimate kinase [Clostridia bacterium]|nr:shikimate kinase [Clostridia bacterium]